MSSSATTTRAPPWISFRLAGGIGYWVLMLLLLSGKLLSLKR
jgi:hypothetical protein